MWKIKKTGVANILRAVLRVLWFFPIKKNRILFISYNGTQYSCNPKYVFEYLYAHYGASFEYIWCLNDTHLEISRKYECKQISRNSIFYVFYCITAGIYITNDGISSFIPFRRNQIVINTWHGGGVYKSSGLGGNSQLSKSDELSIKIMARNLTWFISSSEAFSKNMSIFYLIPIEKMLPIGMPRNDILFNLDLSKAIRLQIKNQFNIDDTYGIVIYTPTFRGSIRNEAYLTSDIDVPRLLKSLENKFGKPFKFMFRVHHAVRRKSSFVNGIDVSDYPDIQELLCLADVLVSDYSSILWDFSLTYKPCFVYAPDLLSYQSMDRGFTSAIAAWPFPIASDNDSLERNIMQFHEERYIADVKKHHKSLTSYENGTASRALCRLILEETGLKE